MGRVEGSARRELFDNRGLVRLILPLVIEQLLAITIGMADTVMVSSLGEAAVSSVSLVDNINVLLINIISALTAGGAVVAAQYLGHREADRGCDAARQLYQLTFFTSAAMMAVCLAFNRGMLSLMFGRVEEAVMDGAVVYLILSALSFPFLGLYNSGAALFRAMGNSKVSMYVSVLMNLINIAGNALAIYGLGWGVAGAALASLLSRAVGAVIITVMIRSRRHVLHVDNLARVRFEKDMVGRILRLGVPNGLENGMFQVGKLLVLNLISTFGTASIAANAICNTLASFAILPGMSVGLGMVTVVGQCMGAGDSGQAERNVRKLMAATHLMMLFTGAMLALFSPRVVTWFNLSPEASDIARRVLRFYGICCVVFWPPSFTLPNALRGAGDARFTMIVSVLSMWICRVGLSYLFGQHMGLGVFGVWVAMVCDWLWRGGAFIIRYWKGGWKKQRVI